MKFRLLVTEEDKKVLQKGFYKKDYNGFNG